MKRNFLILMPRRRRDPKPGEVLLQVISKQGKVTQTSDWVSLFNYASIQRYDAIFISASAYAEENQIWQRDLQRLHPHQPLILYTFSEGFKTTLVNETGHIFGFLDLRSVTNEAPIFSLLDHYHHFRESLKSPRAKHLLRPGGFGEFTGNSEPMLDIYRQLTRVAGSDYTVLIHGESGSGKELVARTLHALSDRAERPFVSINCAAIPENLLESELFGFEKGAFTGASQAKVGKFEAANGGTLFLDEIGDMPLELQVKLLRVLEERRIQPLGSLKETSIDIRLVTATHRDLGALIKEGQFREDLHYRLNVIPLELPPLRHRGSDLILLVLSVLSKLLGKSTEQDIAEVEWSLIQKLASHDFKGNVRELENILTRSVIATDGHRLTAAALPIARVERNDAGNLQDRRDALKPLWQVEKEHLANTLNQLEGNISQAAQMLEISRTAIYRKIKKYGLEVPNLGGEGTEELDA